MPVACNMKICQETGMYDVTACYCLREDMLTPISWDVSSVSREALGRRACLAGHGLERVCWCSLKADSTSRNAHGRLGCEQCVKRFSWPIYFPGMV